MNGSGPKGFSLSVDILALITPGFNPMNKNNNENIFTYVYRGCCKGPLSCHPEQSRRMYAIDNQYISTPLNVTTYFEKDFLDGLSDFVNAQAIGTNKLTYTFRNSRKGLKINNPGASPVEKE